MGLRKILDFFKRFLKNLVLKERSPEKLALGFCLGVYIAFSPFPGLHTAMVFVFSWLFKVNWVVVLATSNLVNNPWTMIPIYGSDYLFGKWLCSTFFGCDMLVYNPAWMNALCQWVANYTSIAEVSLLSFVIGGNILGIFFAFVAYPVMKKVFTSLAKEVHGLINKPTVPL